MKKIKKNDYKVVREKRKETYRVSVGSASIGLRVLGGAFFRGWSGAEEGRPGM